MTDAKETAKRLRERIKKLETENTRIKSQNKALRTLFANDKSEALEADAESRPLAEDGPKIETVERTEETRKLLAEMGLMEVEPHYWEFPPKQAPAKESE